MPTKKKYGCWEIEESIGEGGQAHVFLVTDTDQLCTGRFVLKRLKNDNRKHLFEREIRALQELQHPNILRIEDFDLSGSDPYYVAEYCERASLSKIGADKFKGNIDNTATVLVPITQALCKAHSLGIIHRDVKPQNILIRADGSSVLADFGICHMDGLERVTLTDEAMKPINYIAPEMESGRRFGKPTDKTDAYSLGKVLYWMLSGGLIFARENHRDVSLTEVLNDQGFEHIHMLLDRVLIENPAQRISATDFLTGLTQARSLISGHFAPLKPSIGIRCTGACTWCCW
jgi:serine/threonine protein kinase